MKVDVLNVMPKLRVFGVSLFFALALISCASSQEISFDYPEEVHYGEEFEVTLELLDFEQEVYDVKIDIIGDGSRIARIWNGEKWSSTIYYVNDAIDTSESNESVFSLNITQKYNGTAFIEVKIKSGSTKSFPDYEIEVLEEEPEDEQEEEDNEENESESDEEDIYLDMNWEDDEIVNGEEFKIEVTAFELESEEYDIKITISKDDGDIISEIYDEKEDKWKSSSYYINEVFKGPGEKTETVTLRINSKYEDFYDYVNINAKIRKTGTSTILAEEEYDIEILEKENGDEDEEENEDSEESYANYEAKELSSEKQEAAPEGVIRLGNREKTETVEEDEKGEILYESSNEKIKKYSMYGLNILLVVIIIFLLISFKNRKN